MVGIRKAGQDLQGAGGLPGGGGLLCSYFKELGGLPRGEILGA